MRAGRLSHTEQVSPFQEAESNVLIPSGPKALPRSGHKHQLGRPERSRSPPPVRGGRPAAVVAAGPDPGPRQPHHQPLGPDLGDGQRRRRLHQLGGEGVPRAGPQVPDPGGVPAS